MTIEVWRASELDVDPRSMISKVFIEGFGEHLTFFSKDRKKLTDAFEHSFALDVFYVAVIAGEISAIAACTDGHGFAINHRKKELIENFGWIKGTFADLVFKREFQKPPAMAGAGIASVEFVATARAQRGRGAASALMQFFFALPQYHTYVLEVADTNKKAVNLYRQLGFKEFKRAPQKNSRFSGINELIYMKYEKHPN